MSTTSEKMVLYTIGHSTRTFEEFVTMLRSFSIEQVVDIRRFPRSRKFPQFSKENLEISLPEKSIKYIHFEALGGRRKPDPTSKNTSWRNVTFRGYADYMRPTLLKKKWTNFAN